MIVYYIIAGKNNIITQNAIWLFFFQTRILLYWYINSNKKKYSARIVEKNNFVI